ncbi:MAG: heme ABC exporter ATP-binding protein CcmA [Chloroflexi bacterium]|nr:heme ABC exporter ATP-binding protein CcmA [Chloroflexota bacterium]
MNLPAATEVLAVDVRGVTKTFGDFRVLRGIDLVIKPGESVVIFGPNGAGKTTLIKVLATLLKPTSGNVRMAGFDLRTDAAQIRRKIGLVSHQTFLYDDLTVLENLKFYGKMYDVPNLDERVTDIVARVGLTSHAYSQARTLSRGMQQRLSIARAVIHNPSIVLLDEPETGLDQDATVMLGEMLASMNGGQSTIIMTTHSLEYGLRMGSRIVIIAQGKVVYEEEKQALDVRSLREAYRHFTGVH